eukprot:6471446-Amphidinium_carterae.3
MFPLRRPVPPPCWPLAPFAQLWSQERQRLGLWMAGCCAGVCNCSMAKRTNCLTPAWGPSAGWYWPTKND